MRRPAFKGKWNLTGKDANGAVNVFTDKEYIATVRHEYDAHLIASAPELYKTGLQLLKVMCELCRRLNPQHETCQSCFEIEQYRKAFAKAVPRGWK